MTLRLGPQYNPPTDPSFPNGDCTCTTAPFNSRHMQRGEKRHTSNWALPFHMQGSGDIDSLGNPYGFTPTPLPQHAPSFPVMVTTQMSRPRSVDQLILLSDGHYLSSSTASLSLRLVTYNADAHALTYARAVFEWQQAGLITASPPFILSLPVLAYASYDSSR